VQWVKPLFSGFYRLVKLSAICCFKKQFLA
jgi:hypothetical protein